MLKEKDKHLLTRTENRISYLYIDMARIEQTEYGVEVIQGERHIELPITTINVLILGPGVSITHKAICNIAAASCSICFTGMEMTPFYAYGEPATNSSKNLLIQIKCHESKALHLDIVHKMYEIRYPGCRLKTKTVEELRGIEGQKVKECYETLSKEYGVEWNGRSYNVDNFDAQDDVNKYITTLNHLLYAIVTAATTSLGFSPAIGFIHTGHVCSFVYDISDLYKEKWVFPLAFKLASKGAYDKMRMTTAFRELVAEEKIMPVIVKDILSLFGEKEAEQTMEVEMKLWGDKNYGTFGKNLAPVW